MEQELAEAAFTVPLLTVLAVTLILAGATVVLHYEVLSRLNMQMRDWRLLGHGRILVMMFVIVLTHLFEMCIWGGGLYLALAYIPDGGSMTGASDPGVLDAIYLSMITYSTLGYGDLAPMGPIRFLLGTESMLGLLMITWSASFSYLEMQRYWQD